MNLLWDAYQSVSGSAATEDNGNLQYPHSAPHSPQPQRSAHPSIPEDEVVLICDRLSTATMPEDKRHALQ
eukprot:Pgem_evm1s11620